MAAAFALAAVTGCTPAVLSPAGPVAAADRTILLDSLVIMLAIVIPTLIGLLAFAWWFRASNTRARYRPDWTFSGQIELVVWAIPLLTILLLGGVSWVGAHALDPYKPLPSRAKTLEVQVVSLDWKWLFIYPEQGVASVNSIVAPAGAPIHFSLTSSSVMNAFFVPRLGSMIYTMNGMVSQLNLQADKPGVFPGLSSHYSGDGFSGMHFDLQAVPPAAFDAWVARARAAGPALDAASYAALAKQSSDVAPFTYSTVQSGLFHAVASQAIAPADGPSLARREQSVHPKGAR